MNRAKGGWKEPQGVQRPISAKTPSSESRVAPLNPFEKKKKIPSGTSSRVCEWYVVEGERGLKKRIWSGDEKRTNCAQTLTPGVSVAQVAHRYWMSANLIFKWLNDFRFSPAVGCIALDGVFLPVEIAPSALESDTAPTRIGAVAAAPVVNRNVFDKAGDQFHFVSVIV